MNLRYIFFNIVAKLLPPPIHNKLKINRFKRTHYNSEMWGGGIYSEELDKAILKFGNEETTSNKNLQSLKDDIILSYILYGATPAEYYLLGFNNKSLDERNLFITDRIKDEHCLRTMSISKFNDELTNKYNFYLKNKQYFKREAILIDDDNCSFTKFITFITEHNQVFAKPIGGSYGLGAHIINSSTDLAAEYHTLVRTGQWIIEEVISQDKRMSQWNPTSVNTVRIPSILVDDKSYVLGPFFRTGKIGAIIDNAGGGGILAAIDPSSGTIISDGFSEANITFTVHPDSGIQYKGWTIPMWQDLLKLTNEVHLNMHEHKYIAFDFALTPDGWVLIEGNWGQFLSQYATKVGLKNQFITLMNSN